ncbi:MAG: hypothetical protein JW863_16345, partial [Chitinispirillaceae bacterium]|nr:hypothetical protein [Chitinispirillaceae bacterium]
MYLKDRKNTPDLPSAEASDNGDAFLAQRIQVMMQPRTLPSLEGVELGFLQLPGRQPGGDLFDVLKISEDVLALLMFEVREFGMRSMLIAAMAKICFTSHLSQNVSPAAVIERV